MQNASDTELLQDYATRSSEPAFAALVTRHLDWVHSAALRQVRDPHLAEEVAQTVFVILARKAARLRPGTILSGWLYRTVLFAARTALRTEHRRQRREQEAQQMHPNPNDSDRNWEEFAPILDEALGRLGAKDRDAVVLHYFEKKSLREVGLALGTNEDAAQKRVSRAVEKLRRSITRRGVLAPGVALAPLLAAHAVQAAPAGLASSITTASLAGTTAVSASTLTLTQGTLALMAWTKTKSAILAGIAFLLASGITTVTLLHFAGKKPVDRDIQGAWEGTLNVNEAALRLVLKISRTPDGRYRATLDSIDQGARDVPISSVSCSNSTVRVDATALFSSYEAQLNPAGTEMAGTWTQVGRSFPLVLNRTEQPTTIPGPLAESAFVRRAGSDLQGYWKGTISVGQSQLRLAFKISEPAAGIFAGTLDSLDQGARDVPVSSIAYTKPTVEIELTGLGARFEGELNTEGTEISGTWEQGRRGTPLVLKRSDPGEAESKPAESAYAHTRETDLQGFWNGTLQVKDLKLRLALQIAKLPDGTFKGTMDSIDQGAKGIPMTTVTYTNPEVQIEWKALGASFRGTLEHGKLTGTFKQGPASFPLVFERAKSATDAKPTAVAQ